MHKPTLKQPLKIRIYYDHIITYSPAKPLRWQALTRNGYVSADTLSGVKQLIRGT